MTERYEDLCSRPEFAADFPGLPERFQNYHLDKNKLGEGPVSFVYRAVRVDTQRQVRLKVLRKRICQLSETKERFLQLAHASSIYVGENLLSFSGSGAHDQILFFESEYVEAVSLRKLIDEESPFHPDLAALIAMEIIGGLNQIHGIRPSAGMGNRIPLHRNLKPENVLITDTGLVKLSDFDLQQMADLCDHQRLPIPYARQCYQSPEQLLRGGYADRRSDLYSLGIIMLEMVTGRLPFEGKDIFETRQNIREERREKARKLLPSTSDKERRTLAEGVVNLIASMIEHDPEKRTQTLLEVENNIGHYLEGARYDDPRRSIAAFVTSRLFQSQRVRKKGFIDRLFEG